MGLVTVLVAALMSAAGLMLGHLIGPPEQSERAAVGIGGIARNVGLAIFVVTLSGVQREMAPTILAYMVLGFAFGVPYAVWSRRKLARGG